MVAAEIKPFIGQKCTVKYGEKVAVEGLLLKADTHHLKVKAKLGEYTIPLEQVRSVTPLT